MKIRKSILSLLLCFTVIPVVTLAENEDITGYDEVTITIQTPSYNGLVPPQFAKVKYNKVRPLIITSDDMGASEMINSWAFFNGYPAFSNDVIRNIPRGNEFLNTPYNHSARYQQVRSIKRGKHEPLTYSDGTGGVRRFTATSAIWPYEAENTTPSYMNSVDAKMMMRTGWSFAQHDVDKEYATDSFTIASRFKYLSDLWEGYTGVGLKVMVEPNGSHKYISAGRMSDEICWNIFQNGVKETFPEVKDILIKDWATGKEDWTSFDYKPKETTRRFFFQDKEEEFFKMIEENNDSCMVLGGSHGLSSKFLAYLKNSVQPKDMFWVAGADEVWEYYHLYNHSSFSEVYYVNGFLTINVLVPRYKKHQFRELTINIPGIKKGTTCKFSSNVITGSGRQNDGYYTVNIGLENRIYGYIEELLEFYRANQHNTYVKDDLLYLINLLVPGTIKEQYLERLNAAPAFGTYVVSTSIGDSVLVSGTQDEPAEVTYHFPKYMLRGTTLYEAHGNETMPYYVSTFAPAIGNDKRTVVYTKALENVVCYVEGEEMDNTTYSPANMTYAGDKNHVEYYSYRWSSNGGGGIIQKPVVIGTLQPGIYKLVLVAGGSNNKASSVTSYTLKLGGIPVCTFQSTKASMEEFVKKDIVVTVPQVVSLEAENPNETRWVDYLFLQKTGDYDTSSPEVTLSSDTTVYDATNDVPLIDIVARSKAKNEQAIITKTFINDNKGNTIAESGGSRCSYSLTPTKLGDYAFMAYGTDSEEKMGVSDRMIITVKADLKFKGTTNMGDILTSFHLKEQKSNLDYTFLYPRFLLKGTDLYETQPREETGQPYYGENLQFTIGDTEEERVINYEKAYSNVICYKEGEDLEGALKVTQNYGLGVSASYYALMMGSNGAAGKFKKADVVRLPAGKYRVYAGLGKTANSSKGDIKFSFCLDDNPFYVYIESNYPCITDVNEDFEVTSPSGSLLSITIDEMGDKHWVDYVFIQKVDNQEESSINPIVTTESVPLPTYDLRGLPVNSRTNGLIIRNGTLILSKP